MIIEIKNIVKDMLGYIFDPKTAARDFEIYKLEKMSRYKPGRTRLLGPEVHFPDSASFLSAYREIFSREIYKFNSDNNHPYIIDCGANIGLSIIYLKKIYPKAEIIAFEPDEKIFKILERNIESLKLKNVKLIQSGISNEETTADFYSEGADGGRIAQLNDKNNIIKIKTTRLNYYLQKPVDLLKIDIEGTEYDVLKDCQILLKNVKNLFVEYHSFVDAEQKLPELLKILKEAEFKIFINRTGLSLNQPFIQKKNNLGMDLQLNIFAYRT